MRKKIIRLTVLFLLLSGAAFLCRKAYRFCRTEMGPLHVSDTISGIICPCEYGDSLVVEIDADAVAHCRFSLPEGKGERVYIGIQVSEPNRIIITPHISNAEGRIPTDVDERGLAPFSFPVPEKLFKASEGYRICTLGSGSRWIGNSRQSE